ncbi:cyclase family protein [Litchfieldia salsa]|uniref:Kynurenine formamidase n=1 Tax=Litchfieldia salsa TaxID=930152 RepID=A0A1H0WHJ1_9BACI|nr:cyclase family protein [Litchfieldia salsa]SDP90200.1 Kynurenine formamidase [Litchfieldia salsa]
MKIYDVSTTIQHGMAVYENKSEKKPTITTVTDGYISETRLDMDVHNGTHVDAPLHMIVNGEAIETLALEDLVGSSKVFDLTDIEDKITRKDLEALDIQKNDFIIFKTKNSFEEEFNFDFIFLAKEAAKYLVEKGIRGVATDALGIERSQEGHPTHKTLFGANIIIIEGLRLKDVPAGEYFMVAAPLKLTGIEAAPARILLLEGVQASQ